MRPDLSTQIEFNREPLPSLAALENQWRSIGADRRASFFTSWHWIGTLLTMLPEAKQPSLLRGSVGGQTVALALLGERAEARRLGFIRSRAFFINETGDPDFDLAIEHNGLVVASGYENAANKALTEWFAEQSASADELRISGAGEPLPEPVLEQCGLDSSQAIIQSYYVETYRLAASDGELFPVLSNNARHQLRRAIRYFEQFGPLQLQRAATVSEANDFFSGLKELHCATWERRGKRHAFSRGFFEPYHRRLIERSLAAGAIELLRATAGERVIGYLYNFRHARRIYAYQSGFAYDGRHARPGVVCHALAIRDAYRSGASLYDFLAGHNRLKESFATACEPMFWQVIQQPRLAFRLEKLARRAKQRVEKCWPRLQRLKSDCCWNRQTIESSECSDPRHRSVPAG